MLNRDVLAPVVAARAASTGTSGATGIGLSVASGAAGMVSFGASGAAGVVSSGRAPADLPSADGSSGCARITASRLIHYEVLEEIARASAISSPELLLRVALGRQWGPFLTRGAAAFYTLAASVSPASTTGIEVALEALFAHHCSFGW
jgi:hypothetical protein